MPWSAHPPTGFFHPRKKANQNGHASLVLVVLSIIAVVTIAIIIIKPSLLLQIIQYSSNNQGNVIGVVGDESIYKKDLDMELKNYPKVGSIDNLKKTVLNKMATDSIILQGAQADKLIQLDSSFYNSENKDYQKRLAMVSQIKQSLSNQGDTIQGEMVSVWFYNNTIGPLGLDKAKQTALDKISKLHDQVKNKQITIKKAGDQIKQDSSLAQLDVAYKQNAYLLFKVKKGQPITVDPNFDDSVWKLEVGQVSDVFLAQDIPANLGKKTDAFYVFAQVDDKVNGKPIDFDAWLAQKKKEYATKL